MDTPYYSRRARKYILKCIQDSLAIATLRYLPTPPIGAENQSANATSSNASSLNPGSPNTVSLSDEGAENGLADTNRS